MTKQFRTSDGRHFGIISVMLFGFSIIIISAGCGGGSGGSGSDLIHSFGSNQATSQNVSLPENDPIEAPKNFQACCEDSKAILQWEKIEDKDNIGYKIYSCTEAECVSEKETINDPEITEREYKASNGIKVCYAISGLSSNANRSVLMSEIECTTPSEGPYTPPRLISPKNNDTITYKPTFYFLGNGKSVYYVLSVKGKDNTLLMSKLIESQQDDQYHVPLNENIVLILNSYYVWTVSGFEADGEETRSQSSFFFKTDYAGPALKATR